MGFGVSEGRDSRASLGRLSRYFSRFMVLKRTKLFMGFMYFSLHFSVPWEGLRGVWLCLYYTHDHHCVSDTQRPLILGRDESSIEGNSKQTSLDTPIVLPTCLLCHWALPSLPACKYAVLGSNCKVTGTGITLMYTLESLIFPHPILWSRCARQRRWFTESCCDIQ